MSFFLLACGGLVLFSGLFYFFPAKRQTAIDQAPEDSNLDWFRLRQRELAELGDSALEEDIRLRLLEDSPQSASTLAGEFSDKSFPVWVLLPLVAIVAAGMYYKLGAVQDVVIMEQLEQISADSAPEDMQALMLAIETRSEQRPDNLHYVAMLGRYYMGQEDYAKASETYKELLLAAPNDAQALAYGAQADFLANQRELSDSARMQAERALAVDPQQRTALGLLGMASFEQKSYRAAIEYWQRLLVTEQPGSAGAKMISSVIEMAQQALGEEGADTASVASVVEPTTNTVGVSVIVSMPADAVYDPTDTVFVLARSAASDSRMPIAVQRFQAGQLPVTLRLDDQSSMAGQQLSQAGEVVVVVQVSPEGKPGEANASYLGEAGPLLPSIDSEPVNIQLRPR
ncbi:MAG: cytochrome C biogenesis protein [Halioglobus sp.]